MVDRLLYAPLRSRLGSRVPLRLGSRRRGSVLVLVMALLGIIFVIGMTFLTTMNFEAELIALERNSYKDETGVDAIEQVTDQILRNSLLTLPGMVGNTSSLGEWDDGSGVFEPDRLTLAELPNVHSLIAQIEPHWDPNSQSWVYDSFTNFAVLQGRPPWPTAWSNELDLTEWVVDNGGVDFGPNAVVDSDGDGIADTRQTALTAGDVSEAQLATLEKLVNAPANPGGPAYLGLRVIPHGGMVNLSESHPNLIANVFDIDIAGIPLAQLHLVLPQFELDWLPYASQAEEASLRRRGGLLPPRVLSPTAIQGDPLVDDVDPEYGVPGGGDFAYWLFPPGESVWTGEENHRHWPFSVSADEFDIWLARMDPFSAGNGQYDRRHLVTTISHDDLLSRGGWTQRVVPGLPTVPPVPPNPPSVVETDVLDRMREANLPFAAMDGCFDSVTGNPIRLPFEYVNYPHTVPNGYYGEGVNVQEIDWCQCAAELNGCKPNLRKGRLKLSLPWLDEAERDQVITWDEKVRLIQEAFTMMLLNARSPYWGTYVWYDTDGIPGLDEWAWEWNAGSLDEIERTAAALTANLIDFADADDVSTPVEIRQADFSNTDYAGRGKDFPEGSCPEFPATCLFPEQCVLGRCATPCATDAACAMGDVCSRVTPSVSVCTSPTDREYVYGLERQPYITEVAADVTGGLYGVELINPHPDLIATANVYRLRVTPGGGAFTDFQLSTNVMGGRYLVASNSASWTTTAIAPGASVEVVPLFFANGDTIHLLRMEQYPDPANPGSTITIPVVVDQFTVNGANTAAPLSGESSMQRPNVVAADVTDRWYAPIPAGAAFEVVGHSLGLDNTTVDPERQPVQVLFANTGALADIFDDTGLFIETQGAFPTTGSLLLLMRHANAEFDPAGGNLAFTTELLGDDDTVAFNPAGPPWYQDVAVQRSTQIDNGRMPVFDEGMVHHVDARLGPIPEPLIGGAAYLPWEIDRPGELYHLPWGQLVFDYFTALPLSNEMRPYRDSVNPDPSTTPWASQPRVDLDGLRVHGRINLNAAPWKVLAGLPLVPMNKIPEAFRPTFRLAAGLVWDDPLPVNEFNPTPAELRVLNHEAGVIGDELAKSIVAYREVRALTQVDDNEVEHTTGEYGNTMSAGPGPQYGRGWDAPGPAARRGTGFLSVGELANVHHDDAATRVSAGPPCSDPTNDQACHPERYQIDSDILAGGGSYLEAIALLASLGDWVTVRSHVFTVYGTLRGDPDPTLPDTTPAADIAADVDSRALRFQETLDRLPTFLGEPAPVRIGERVLTSYSDLRND